MNDKLNRKDFMTEAHKQAMGNLPRTHYNCRKHTGVARPGKTAHERNKRVTNSNPTQQ